MKKCFSFFMLFVLARQTIFTANFGRLTKKSNPALDILIKGRSEAEQGKADNTPVNTPRQPGKLPLTPRSLLTPRSSEEFYLPYFFDGTIQKVFLKKREGFDYKKRDQNTPTVFLIPIDEKEDFKTKMGDFLTPVEELDSTGVKVTWFEKVKDISKKDLDNYVLYTIGHPSPDEVLSPEHLKNITLIQKTITFIPLFYQMIDEKVNVLILEEGFAKDTLQEDILEKINSIVRTKFKIESFEIAFKPIVIVKGATLIIFMQAIDISKADLHDISLSKEYVVQPVKEILKATSKSPKDIFQMKSYLSKLYLTLKQGKYDKEKIDKNFVEIFMKDYVEHQAYMKELEKKTEADRLEKERVAKEKQEALAKKQSEEEKIAEEKRTKLKELAKNRGAASQLPSEEEKNVVPSEVIQEKEEEKARVREAFEAKNGPLQLQTVFPTLVNERKEQGTDIPSEDVPLSDEGQGISGELKQPEQQTVLSQSQVESTKKEQAKVAQEEMQREPVRADVVLEEKSKSEKPTETPSEKVEPVPEQQAQILLENPIATSEPSSEDQPEKIIKPEKQSIAGKTSPESQQLEKQMPVTVVEQQDNPLNVDSPSSQPQSQPQSREEKLAEKVQQQGIQLKSVPTAVVRKETSESKEAPKTPFEKIERVLVPREQDQSPLQSEAKSDFWDNLIEGWNSFWGAVADFFIGIGTSISSFF